MRIAIVHDWLTGMRGGERVIETMLALFPEADLFALIHVPGSVSEAIERRVRGTSFIQNVPFSAQRYRSLLPLFPLAIERLDLRGYDLVISSSTCVAKGAIARNAPHLCYCNTPMRYIWDQYDAYLASAGPLTRTVWPGIAARLRAWDVQSAARVTQFLANSTHIQARIRATYGRAATVLYPGVDVTRFTPAQRRKDAYVYAGALVPYKRVDLAISAFNRSGRELLVVGSGPEYQRLRRMAGPTIRFTGHVDDNEFARIVSSARGLLMPMHEDFGIIAVEAQAAGTPVIAYAAGGALETVIAGQTGVFFAEQTVAALGDAVERAEAIEFRTEALQASAARFSVEQFNAGMLGAIEAVFGAIASTSSRAIAS
jgi:glycosyltransferase involved in cell wall biosynthesis